MDLPAELAVAVEANAVEQITGVATNCSGITYPQGGWLCPAELTRNVLELAQQQGLQIYYQYQLQNLSRKDDCWLLNFAGDQQATHSVVVLANGHQISRFSQTSTLPVYSVAGQVSHIPTTPELAELKQVLCYDGYPRHKIRRINIIVLVPVIIAAAKIRRTVRTISSRIASG